ncbi:peptide deformylase [Sulfurimonas sp. HSL-1716]|uniref:peptide deformylase n=1 Tax=Hydrocurvibacter sulfurireducens TaxID=3131937 RepID=UPI0031F7DF5B
MNLTILTYPDKRLKQKSKNVTKFDENIHKLLDAMNETMLLSNGIGLAAIQVNHPLNILILNIPDSEGNQPTENLMEIINPILIKKEGSTVYQEGCLSVPGFYEDIERYETITINYQDRDGNTKTLDADGLLSIAIQHEMDHLTGNLFIEKLSYARRKKFEKEYKKAIKEKRL